MKTNKRELNEAITSANVEDKILEAIADDVTEIIVSKSKFKTIIMWGIQNKQYEYVYGIKYENDNVTIGRSMRINKVCGINISIKN